MIVALVVFGPVIYVASESGVDYDVHYALAMALRSEPGSGLVPHFFYHLTVIVVATVLPMLAPTVIASIPVVVATLGLTGLVWWHLREAAYGQVSESVLIVLALCTMLMTPILVIFNIPFFVGYIHTTLYHNPTLPLMKLFALPAWWLALAALNPLPGEPLRRQVYRWLMAALVSMVMILSKPNFTLALLPALGVLGVVWLVRRQALDWGLLVFGIGLPSVATLAAQFLSTYSAGTGSGITISPLGYLNAWTPTAWLPIMLAGSLVFPVVVVWQHGSAARRDVGLWLAWLTLLIGLGWFYLFAESGPRYVHGNFSWGAYGAMFVLMVSSVALVVREHGDALNSGWRAWSPRLRVTAMAFGLHVMSGAAYYAFFVAFSLWFSSL